MSQNSRLETGSTPVVGSSSSRISGRWINVQARASFFCIPPERWAARRFLNSVSPAKASNRSVRSCSSEISTSYNSAKKDRFSATESSP